MDKAVVLSEISRDIAQVSFASVFVDPIIRGDFNPTALLIGLSTSVIMWYVSFIVIKN